MEFISDIVLDINSNTAYTVVGAKQGDNNTRVVTAHLTQNGAPYQIEAGATATFRFRKPDGKAIINDAEIKDYNEGIIAIGLTSQALAAAGRGYADIVLTKNQQILSTVSFIIVIMASPQVLSEIISSNEFGYIEDIVASSRNTIYESEAWAVGERAGQPVSSENFFDWTFSSPGGVIRAIQVTKSVFESVVGSHPGSNRTFTFTYVAIDNYWNLVTVEQVGGTSTTSSPQRCNDINSFGIEISYLVADHPNNDDSITVYFTEADITYQNNSKYWAGVAASAYTDFEAQASIYIESAAIAAASASDARDDITNRLTVSSITLAAGSSATVQKNTRIIDEKSYTNLAFGIPKGDKGDTGDVYYATFEIEPSTGYLWMYRPDDMTQINFEIGDSESTYPGCLLLELADLGG